MKQTEHQLQAQIVTYLKLKKWTVINCDVMTALAYIQGSKLFAFIKALKNCGYMKGQPDIVCIKNGVVLFLEIKRDNKAKVPKEQREFADICKRECVNYHLITSFDEIESLT